MSALDWIVVVLAVVLGTLFMVIFTGLFGLVAGAALLWYVIWCGTRPLDTVPDYPPSA